MICFETNFENTCNIQFVYKKTKTNAEKQFFCLVKHGSALTNAQIQVNVNKIL